MTKPDRFRLVQGRINAWPNQVVCTSFKKLWVRLATSGMWCADSNLGQARSGFVVNSWDSSSRSQTRASIVSTNLASQVVQCRLQGSNNDVPGSGGEERPLRTVDLQWWDTWRWFDDQWRWQCRRAAWQFCGKFQQNLFLTGFYLYFLAAVAIYSGMIRSMIVSRDKDDWLEAGYYLVVAVIHRTKVGKMAKRCYCTALTYLFWAIFLRERGSSMATIYRDLF